MKKNSVQWLCVTAISTALFVVLTLCLQVPIFENYYLCLGYLIMAVCLYSFGITCGTFVGCAGVILYCLLTSGLRGMPGWVLGNLVIGVLVGLAFHYTKKLDKTWLKSVLNFCAIALSVALGILVVKSFTECLLYSQPMVIRMGKNVFAFVADIVVLEAGLPLCMLMDGKIRSLFKMK